MLLRFPHGVEHSELRRPGSGRPELVLEGADQLDADNDFEPFENNGATLDVIGNPGGLRRTASSVGILTPSRVSWDPGYGYVDPNLQRLMQIHNIWKQSHQTAGSCKVDADCTSLTGRAPPVWRPADLHDALRSLRRPKRRRCQRHRGPMREREDRLSRAVRVRSAA